MTAFINHNTVPGQGPRIYIPHKYHNPTLSRRLKRWGAAGGYTNDTGKCFGYEFPNQNLMAIGKATLIVLGFDLIQTSDKTREQIWG